MSLIKSTIDDTTTNNKKIIKSLGGPGTSITANNIMHEYWFSDYTNYHGFRSSRLLCGCKYYWRTYFDEENQTKTGSFYDELCAKCQKDELEYKRLMKLHEKKESEVVKLRDEGLLAHTSRIRPRSTSGKVVILNDNQSNIVAINESLGPINTGRKRKRED